MSFLARLKAMPKESLYVAVLVAMVSTLSHGPFALQMIDKHRPRRLNFDLNDNKFDEPPVRARKN